VLAPCALGGVLTAATVPALRCRAICGAANNQLDDDATATLLASRGVLFAPDFVANAGGIINIAEEFTGYDRARALERVEGIEATMRAVFDRASADGVVPQQAAESIAWERLEREGGGHWRAGDPTAWTNGEPLRALRPVAA
jgi:leucine dehydrogenase